MSNVYVAVDIGCIECGEPSNVIGVFTDREVAEQAAEFARTVHESGWDGEHYFFVQEVTIDAEYTS